VLAADPNGKKYFAGYSDGLLNRWDPEAVGKPKRVAKFESRILQIVVGSGGKLIAAALDERHRKSGVVKIVDAENGAEKATIGDWDGAPYALAFSGDGNTLVAVGGRGFKPGIARIWDAQTGSVKPVPWPTPKHLLIAAAVSPDGRLLMTNDDNNVRVWDLRDNKSVFRMTMDTPELVQGVAFSPDGKLAAAVCSADSSESDAPGLLLVWNTADWSEVKRVPLDCGAEHVAFSPDGRYIAATRRDNTIGLWTTKDWKPAIEFLPMGGYIAALTFSPDSTALGIATSEDGLSTWPLP
jgi:WD40 repeat protein